MADRVGDTTTFALFHLEERGELFIGAGEKVYEGMLVGENARAGDMDVNVAKEAISRLANTTDWPNWPAGNEFRALRDAQRAAP